MKKFIILLLTLLLVVSNTVFASANYTDSFDVDAKIAYVVSANSDATVIYDKGSDTVVDPGEIVKLVTGILVLENCPDLNVTLTASETAIRSIENLKVTRAGILVGETATIGELLYCLLVYNCSESANVLAEHVGGTIDNFVVMMNDFAKKLELKNTSFSNPGGYNSENQYSTAKDIAAIMNYCIQNANFIQISSTFRYEMPPTNKYKDTRYLINTNSLINGSIEDYYYKYVKCGKSGQSKDGLCNCVSYASKDGYNYICVILGAEDKDYDLDTYSENMSFVSSKELLKWIFDNIKLREVANIATYVGEVKVNLSSTTDYVGLVPSQSVSALVPSGVSTQSVYIEPIASLTKSSVDAPVKKGDVLGRAAIKYAGSVIAEVDLVASFDVERSTSKYIGEIIRKILVSPVFLITVFIIIVFAIVCFLISYRNKQKLRLKRIRAINNDNSKDKKG